VQIVRYRDQECTCGFCDGVTVRTETVDPRTGTADQESFERMSRRPRCPVCGGVNVKYRRSYTAHAATVAREHGRTRRAYFVTLVLDAEAADRAGIDGEESYQVLAGQGGVWTRTRRAIRRRDGEAQYLGTLSARPSDGRWHAHVLLLTSLTADQLRRALHVTGADAYVSTPEGEAHEQFGARKGAYAFDNAASSPSARFISSRGEGVGYDSEAAVSRRRNAARQAESDGPSDPPNGAPDPGARSLSRNQQRESDGESDQTEGDSDDNSPVETDSTAATDERAPPVRCSGEVFGGLEAYMSAVKAKLTSRVGTTVYIHGLGNAQLLKVADAADRDGIDCTVAPEIGDGTVTVAWSEVSARDVPRIRHVLNSPESHAQPMRPDQDSDTEADSDPVERFYSEARYSTVTTELPDGRRRVTVKDHRTGEFSEHIKPPRDRA